MNLGISTASLYTKFATENCFSALRDIGVDTTEVFFSSFSEYEKGFVDALVTRQNGMKVHSVHAVSNQFEGELLQKRKGYATMRSNSFERSVTEQTRLAQSIILSTVRYRLKNPRQLFLIQAKSPSILTGFQL